MKIYYHIIHFQNIYSKTKINTPGTAGGLGGRDRMLAVKSRKMVEKSPFFLKKASTHGARKPPGPIKYQNVPLSVKKADIP